MHLKQFRFRGNLVFCLLLTTQTTFGGRRPAGRNIFYIYLRTISASRGCVTYFWTRETIVILKRSFYDVINARESSPQIISFSSFNYIQLVKCYIRTADFGVWKQEIYQCATASSSAIFLISQPASLYRFIAVAGPLWLWFN